MIGRIIDALSAASPQVGQRYGLCEKKGDVIYQYVGGGNGQQVNVDQNGTWSYFRITSTITKQRDTNSLKACDGWRYTIPLRFVLVTRRDDESCSDHSAQILTTASSFVTAKRSIGTSLRAQLVKIDRSGIEADTTRAFKTEVGPKDPPLEIVFQYIDLTVELLLDEECLELCGPSGSILCELVQAASNAQLIDCITEERLAELCGEDPQTLCEAIAAGTPQQIVDCIEDADKTAEVQAIICDPVQGFGWFHLHAIGLP